MENKKEQIRIALGRARANGGYAPIAEAIGFPAGSLRAFASSGQLGPGRRRKLEQYLIENGYLVSSKTPFGNEPPAEKAHELPGDPFAECIVGAEALVAVLKSPRFSEAKKSEHLQFFIRFYGSQIKAATVSPETRD